MSLRVQAFSGLFWSAADRFGQQAFKFVVQIILARLLLPEQFGLIAILIVFITLGKAFTDAGFTQALIQKKDLHPSDANTVFAFNLILSFGVISLLYGIAPYVSRFYDQPELTALLRFLSASIFFGALSQVHLALLTRNLEFNKTIKASVPATVIAGTTAVILAYHGWGVWALAANAILQSALMSVFLWIISPWRPGFTYTMDGLRSMFSYGSRLAIAGLIHTLSKNLFVLVIGKAYSPIEVGFYHKANTFKRMGAENLSSIISRVTFPLYSRIQDDPERLRRAFLQSISLLALCFFPIMALLAGIAHPLIEVLIGPKWLPAAPYLQLLCVIGALYPIQAANLSILKALGKSKLFLRLELFKQTIVLIVLAITWRYGVTAIIIGQIATSFAALWINAYYNNLFIEVRFIDQLKTLLFPLFLSVTVFLTGFYIQILSSFQSLTNLLLIILISLLATIIFSFLLRKYIQVSLRLLTELFPISKRISKTILGKT